MNKVAQLKRIRLKLKENQKKSLNAASLQMKLQGQRDKVIASLILEEHLLDGFEWKLDPAGYILHAEYTEGSGGPAYTKKFEEGIGKYWIIEWDHSQVWIAPNVQLSTNDGDLYIVAKTPEELQEFAKQRNISIPSEVECPTCRGKGTVVPQ